MRRPFHRIHLGRPFSNAAVADGGGPRSAWSSAPQRWRCSTSWSPRASQCFRSRAGSFERRRSSSISTSSGFVPAMCCISRLRRTMARRCTPLTNGLPQPGRCSAYRHNYWHDPSPLLPMRSFRKRSWPTKTPQGGEGHRSFRLQGRWPGWFAPVWPVTSASYAARRSKLGRRFWFIRNKFSGS